MDRRAGREDPAWPEDPVRVVDVVEGRRAPWLRLVLEGTEILRDGWHVPVIAS